MSFHLKLTSLPASVTQYEELQFQSLRHNGQGRIVQQVDPVRDALVGRAVEYGSVLAYLWRRLGYPNAEQGADRLARYVLSTPRPDMYLIVEPTLLGMTSQVFTFVAPSAVQRAAESYIQAKVSAYSGAEHEFWIREQDLRRWNDCDPLTPYARAAARTLRDLLIPVRLEDGEIDLFGGGPRTRRAVNPEVTYSQAASTNCSM